MANRQYERTELAILNALLSAVRPRGSLAFPLDQNLYTLKMSQLAKLARVSRSTIYRHHSKTAAILVDLEKFLLTSYKRRMHAARRRRQLSPRDLYLEVLTFILQYRPFFQILVALGRTNFLEFQIHEILPSITKFYKFSRCSPLFLKLYEKRIATLLEIWILHDFEPTPSIIVGDILYLTQTFPTYFRSTRPHLPSEMGTSPARRRRP